MKDYSAKPMKTEMQLKSRWVDLQCKGHSIDSIAEKTNSDRAWVRHFLQRNNMHALERMAKQRAAERAKQVLMFEQMIHEVYRAWDRSTQVEETIETIEEPISGNVSVNQTPGPSAGGFIQVSSPLMTVVKTKKTTKYKCGDVSYLKAAQEFMREIRSILKIDDGTKRIDLSLSVPGDDSIQATLNVKDIAAAELHEWNIAQKDRLNQLLEMPPPDIYDEPDRPLSTDTDNLGSDESNGNGEH